MYFLPLEHIHYRSKILKAGNDISIEHIGGHSEFLNAPNGGNYSRNRNTSDRYFTDTNINRRRRW